MNLKRLLNMPIPELAQEIHNAIELEESADKGSYSHELDSLIDMNGLKTDLQSLIVFNASEDSLIKGMLVTDSQDAKSFLEKVKYGALLFIDEATFNQMKKRLQYYEDPWDHLTNIQDKLEYNEYKFPEHEGHLISSLLVRRSVSAVGITYSKVDDKYDSLVLKSPGKHAMLTNFGELTHVVFLKSGVAE